ncbi:hypothetical protein OGM63_25630 [Plectonema radiosum NIES-515]|uniref:Uncharacterized protein n=1 Tax=Plectonema radiosum NIES-515 TaxID=2986073 RepID=A0ABT3B638_9CYAN|nr:hypothetical protein [Plectonema radiosum]MCV3216847.1 hypothetical protein [Plectonema radiosum NIES-515]
MWTHALIPDEPLTIASKDGDDAPKYLEKQGYLTFFEVNLTR